MYTGLFWHSVLTNYTDGWAGSRTTRAETSGVSRWCGRAKWKTCDATHVFLSYASALLCLDRLEYSNCYTGEYSKCYRLESSNCYTVETSKCYRLESSDCCCTAELAYGEYCKEMLGASVPGRSLRKGGKGRRAGVCVYTMGDSVFVVASVVNEGLSPCRAWCLYDVSHGVARDGAACGKLRALGVTCCWKALMQRVATGWRRPALSSQVIFRNRALQLVALLRKTTCNLKHPMGLHHPVRYSIMHALQAVLGSIPRSFSLSTTSCRYSFCTFCCRQQTIPVIFQWLMIYMNTYTHTHTHTCVYILYIYMTCIHRWIYMYLCVCVYTFIFILHVHIPLSKKSCEYEKFTLYYVYVYIHTCTNIPACIHIDVLTCMHAYRHANIHSKQHHLHIHAYTHTSTALAQNRLGAKKYRCSKVCNFVAHG